MNYRMTGIAFFVIIVSLVAFLVVGTEGSGHKVFANRAFSGHETFTNKGINVQTDTNQDQGCEGAGGTSGITNACTATSGRGSTQTQVTLTGDCSQFGPPIPLQFRCIPIAPDFCNNIGCQSITCVGLPSGPFNCVTNNGIQLTSCTAQGKFLRGHTLLTCTESGTGITQSGGVSG